MAGTVIHYKRTGNKEKFLAPGPLKEPLHIMVRSLIRVHLSDMMKIIGDL